MPTVDLIEIYGKLGRKIDKFQLNGCMSVGFSVLQANRLAGKYAAPILAHKSPFLVENYFSYYKGGVMSMALAVAECWKIFDEWEKSGVVKQCEFMGTYYRSKATVATPSVLSSCASTSLYVQKTGLMTTNIRQTTLSKIQTSICVMKDLLASKGGLRVYQRGIFATFLNTGLAAWDEFKSIFKKKCKDPVGPTIYTLDEYSMFGKSIASGDFNGDGVLDLAIGAPGFSISGSGHVGTSFVVYGPLKLENKDYNIDSLGAAKLNSRNVPGSMFGSALAVVDLNCDGIDDLAISAPFDGSGSFAKSGVVYVIFGKRNQRWNTSAYDIVISGLPNPIGDFERVGGFGTVLQAIDIDGDQCKDLVIGSPLLSSSDSTPQSGMVHAFSSTSKHRNILTAAQADWSVGSKSSYEHFGSSLSIENNTILVGAPTSSSSNGVTGKVYRIPLSTINNPSFSNSISTDTDKSGFGSSIVVSSSVVAVASPSMTSLEASKIPANMPGLLLDNRMQGYQAGAVHIYNSRQNNPISTLTGFASLGHLGSSMTIDGKLLIITEPLVHAGYYN